MSTRGFVLKGLSCASRIGVTLLLILLVACSEKIDQKKFESLNRADKSIQASLASGVSYIQFKSLLQTFGTELLIAKDAASSNLEKDFLRSYAEAYSIYEDSATLWQLIITSPYENCLLGVAVDYRMEPIIEKYQLTTLDCGKGYGGGQKKSLFKDAFQSLWRRAEAPLQAAGALYRGEPVPSKSPPATPTVPVAALSPEERG